MKRGIIKLCMFLIVGTFFFMCPVSGAMNTISPGGVVFIGEQGLDITAALAGATQVGWWASGAAIDSSSPDYTITISNPSSFYVSPSDFGSRTGNWYTYPSKNTAFNVADPNLDIRIEDTTVNVDVTNKWVPTGDSLRFRIDTNLIPISQRGAGSPPVTIKVQLPSGGIYTALINSAGVSTSLVDIPITTTPYYTASVWDTSDRNMYSPGTYTIWVECNVNQMKDNYGVTGKTISQQVTVLNQDQNPLIGGRTTIATTPSATLVTTQATINPTTTISTPVTTTQSPEITALPTQDSVIVTTPEIPSTPVSNATSTPSPTYAPGFGIVCAIGSLALGLILFLKK
jgi:hypothetical protein